MTLLPYDQTTTLGELPPRAVQRLMTLDPFHHNNPLKFSLEFSQLPLPMPKKVAAKSCDDWLADMLDNHTIMPSRLQVSHPLDAIPRYLPRGRLPSI